MKHCAGRQADRLDESVPAMTAHGYGPQPNVAVHELRSNQVTQPTEEARTKFRGRVCKRGPSAPPRIFEKGLVITGSWPEGEGVFYWACGTGWEADNRKGLENVERRLLERAPLFV